MPLHTLTFYGFAFRALVRDRLNCLPIFDSYRNQSLRSLLRYAHRHVPFQRERLAHIDLNHFQLEDIPPTTKSTMMEHFDETIAKGAVTLREVVATDNGDHRLDLPILKNGYVVHKSSGTSGKPSWMVTGLRDWAIIRGSTLGRMMRDWISVRRAAATMINPVRAATVAAEHAHSMTWQAFRSSDLWARPFVTSRFYPVVDSVENIVAGLNEFRPEYVHAYPTAAEMLAQYRLDGGRLDFEPAIMSVGSEALTAMAREAIHKAFPETILVDHYGMTECLPLSTECRYRQKHLNIDYAILEPRDAEGRPAKSDELSDHVLITNLVSKVQPIIRYRVDDSVRVNYEPCACGSVLPRIEVFSRKGSQIHLRDDRGGWQMLSPPIVVDTMLRAQGVAQFQVIHVRQNVLEVKFIPQKGTIPADVGASIEREFANNLTRLGCGRSVSVSTQQVDSFQRTEGGGKLIQTISLVAPPTAAERMAA